VARRQQDRRTVGQPAVGQPPLGVGRIGGQPLHQHGPDERTPHRPAGPLPVDRRPGVAELAAGQADHVGGRADVDQGGLGGEHAAGRLGVGGDAAGIGEDAGEVVLGARVRGVPVRGEHRRGLGAQGVGQRLDADRDDAGFAGQQSHGGPPAARRAAWRAASAFEAKTAAPAPVSAAT
jgi:hypothetical protein